MSGDLAAGRHGRPRQPLEEIPQEYAAFKIEQRGIDLIPDAERKMTPVGLFWLWSGAVFNVEYFYYGTLVMSFGLSVPQAVAVILIGNLFYVHARAGQPAGAADRHDHVHDQPRAVRPEREPDGRACSTG